jgi:hypothetical protein
MKMWREHFFLLPSYSALLLFGWKNKKNLIKKLGQSVSAAVRWTTSAAVLRTTYVRPFRPEELKPFVPPYL